MGGTVVQAGATLEKYGCWCLTRSVCRGAGRQGTGAVANITSYWGIGIPLSAFLAFK